MPSDLPAPPPPAAVALAVECQSIGRTKACPAFLRGLIDEASVLRYAPRAAADVVVYVNATEVASTDRLHLRFVGRPPGVTAEVEVEATLDTRADDDHQRAALRAAFLRGVVLYVAARRPDAVRIAAPARVAQSAAGAGATSPWGTELHVGGTGSWTEDFRAYAGWIDLELNRTTAASRVEASIGYTRSASRQPALVIDGASVSLDSDAYEVYAAATAARVLDDHWSLGGNVVAAHQDRYGQYELAGALEAGVEWDLYPSDDPRGNRLAIGYVVGVTLERYNVDNELGERRAGFPIHELFAHASVRKDQVTYGLSLEARSQIDRPRRRHQLSASPSLTLQLGGHVDLALALTMTERAVPGPGEIDLEDYQAVTRASYAEPLALGGSLELRVHFDATNGARNDRFAPAGE